MSLEKFSELAAIELCAKNLGRGARSARIELGIGDDAAVIRTGAERLVWTVDACVEGVHFDPRWLSYSDVGFRSMAAAVSDLAAMGARPIAALSALTLPASFSRKDLDRLSRGQAEASRAFGCPIAGGNISRARELTLTTGVLGSARKPLRRDRARIGDEVWLVGALGLSRAGLILLERGAARRAQRGAESAAISAWRRPEPLLEAGLTLAKCASAAIDVSDGLAGDLGHLARASSVRIVLEQAALRASLPSELVRVAPLVGLDALELALFGGEDFALVATGKARRRPRIACAIGRVERGPTGVWLANGKARRRLGGGYDHLRA